VDHGSARGVSIDSLYGSLRGDCCAEKRKDLEEARCSNCLTAGVSTHKGVKEEMRVTLSVPAIDRFTLSVLLSCARAILLLSASMTTTSVLAKAMDLDRPVAFSIESQPIGSALVVFSRQADIQVVITPDVPGTAEAPALHGTLPARIALDTLLRSTGLKYEAVGNSVSVTPVGYGSSFGEEREDADRLGPEASRGDHQMSTGSKNERYAVSKDPQSGVLEEVLVTAQKREERVLDVPMSITAFNEKTLETASVKDISDLGFITPGLTFYPSWQGSSIISIRGISSYTGAATTGVYIDDTPIQVRILGAGATTTNPYPVIFDLDRVEVLKGPQGTLFGGGAEGGAVRFITPEPSFSTFSGHARAEAGFTQDGAPSHEFGAAIGGPIVDNKIAFRLSAYSQSDGGWIDRAPYPHTTVAQPNANSSETNVVRGVLSLKLTDALTITPSIFYQNIKNDGLDLYWRSLSNPDNGDFISGQALASPWQDRFVLYGNKVNLDTHWGTLIANTSYLDRKQSVAADYSNFIPNLLQLRYDAGDKLGVTSPTPMDNGQKSFIQEVRLQSNTATSDKLKWVVGLYYQDTRQTASEIVKTAGIDTLVPGFPPNLPGDITYFGYDTSRDRQEAVFGQVDYKLTDKLTTTVGLRFTKLKFDYANQQGGAFNGGPSGFSGSSSNNAFTPRVGLEYKLTDDALLYANAAKGFRPGGSNSPVPASFCAPGAGGLEARGLTQVPATFDPDSIWSYEAGLKAEWLERRLQVETAAFYSKWNDIQTREVLTCGFGFIANHGAAVSRGFEAHVKTLPVNGLALDVSVAYTDAKNTQTISTTSLADGTRNIVSGDGDLLNVAPWTMELAADYQFPMLGASLQPYVHADYSLRSAYMYGVRPGELNYVYNFAHRPPTRLAGTRVGVRKDDLDLSLFVENLFNSHDQIMSVEENAVVSPDFVRDQSFRPRTIGVTLTMRY
jgi:iron complex outermembrane recepter protein